ncbi:oxidoreductase [Mycobacterium sp. 236(2023)]|uniref:oxidoreductase n=1 Tax=Mycobacterium sp. 236(2023) TaxID=3038163 RepID=UPI0024151525|nr:oxidoreductase [Mycobacterium sp. 236(2023)]MDG4666323.1 oxidoreductase [Mycobacterium sp. 236(2023)]
MARWLITGCSTGIGREIARAALQDGHSVVVTARRVESVADFADDFGDRVVLTALDVTDKGQIAAAVSTATDRFGGIDVLVNNAGNGYLSAIEEGEDEQVRKLFDTNYFGVVDTIKAVLPQMRTRGSGHIVNISSMTGLVANPPNAYYSSTKFALEALTEALAQEVKPFGIKVTAIEPGAFRTDWAARSMWESASPIGDYDENVGARKTMIKEFANHLPGDPRKVAEAVLMVTELDEPPLRLLLGRDVLKAVRDKLATFSASIDEWEAVTKDVNFPTADARSKSTTADAKSEKTGD